MPELPEVEVIKLGLQKKIIGLKITKIQVLSPKSFIGNPNLARGQKVLNIWRKAKILGVDVGSHSGAKRSGAIESKKRSYRARRYLQDDNITWLFHLKMSGQLVYDDGKRPARHASQLAGVAGRFIGGHPTPDMVGKMPNSHTRVIFEFNDKSKLYFNDQRKFGWIRIVDSGQWAPEGEVDSSLKTLGPEPLEDDFTWEILKSNLLKHKSQSVKVALMDQTVVSGVGNIYANEACFNAKIDPRTKVSQLTDKDMRSLHRGVILSLRDGIKHGGSSRAHFVDPEGHKGYFLDYAYVYGRDKHPCKKCGTEIKKIQLGGRGTYFCPKCQA